MFAELEQRALGVAPGRDDWQTHVRSVFLPVELSVTVGGLLFLMAMLAVFAVTLKAARRLMFSVHFEERLLRTPQQRAAGVTIDCVDLRLSNKTAVRFAVAVIPLLAICSLLAYLTCKYCSVSDRAFSAAVYWFIPAIIAFPLFLAVRAVCRRTQKVLGRMRMLDADLHRFMALRLLWFLRHCLVLMAIAAIILLLMPIPGAIWTRSVEQQLLASGRSLYTEAPEDLKRLSQEEFEERWVELARQSESTPLDVQHWMKLWPVGFRLIAGTTVCVGATLLLAGLLLPSVGAERRNAGRYLLWEATITLLVAVAVSLFLGLLPAMTPGAIALFVLSSLLAFGLTFLVTRIVEFGRITVRCPYCGRSITGSAANCPWCGIWLHVGCRIGEGEFVIPTRSDTVHHHECPTLRKHDGLLFMSLADAVNGRLEASDDRVTACKRCLGVNPVWEPDPVWSSFDRWARRLRLLSSSNVTEPTS